MTQEPNVTRPRLREAEVSGSVSINGKESAAVPTDGSTDPGLSFPMNSRQPSADRPTLVTAYAVAQTDGSGDALVNLEVDEDGSGGRDYFMTFASQSSEGSANEEDRGVASFIVPPGGSYQIVNASDPNGGNTLETVREWEL